MMMQTDEFPEIVCGGEGLPLWSGVLQVILVEIAKKFFVFYVIRDFIFEFTAALLWALSYTWSLQSSELCI
jgi:hypothetical protein